MFPRPQPGRRSQLSLSRPGRDRGRIGGLAELLILQSHDAQEAVPGLGRCCALRTWYRPCGSHNVGHNVGVHFSPSMAVLSRMLGVSFLSFLMAGSWAAGRRARLRGSAPTGGRCGAPEACVRARRMFLIMLVLVLLPVPYGHLPTTGGVMGQKKRSAMVFSCKRATRQCGGHWSRSPGSAPDKEDPGKSSLSRTTSWKRGRAHVRESAWWGRRGGGDKRRDGE